MRIHTNTLTTADAREAFNDAKKRGLIAEGVYLTQAAPYRSASHDHALEVKMSAYVKIEGDGRRKANSGYNGSADDYAPTYDEWGWLLAALYAIDDKAIVGSVKHPTYADRDDFEEQTGLTYYPEKLIAVIENWTNYNELHGLENETSDPFPFYVSSTGGQAGGLGRGRASEDHDILPRVVRDEAVKNPGKLVHGYVRFAPRSVEGVRAYAKMGA